MKRSGLGIVVMLIAHSTFAQNPHSLFTAQNGNSGLRNLDSVTQKSRSMEDKANFAKMLNVLGTFAGNDGNNITFQPNLFGVATLFNPSLNDARHFSKNKFLHNSQLNLVFTPSTETIFKYDSIQVGASYAILNNKQLSEADYNAFVATPEYQHYAKLQDALTKFAAGHDGTADADLARRLFKNGLDKSDLPGLPATIKDALKNELGTSDDSVLLSTFTAADKRFKKMALELSKRTLYTVGFNSVYDFVFHRWQELTVTPVNLVCYFGKTAKAPSLSFNLGYSFDQDTLSKANFQRHLLNTTLGLDFIVVMNDDDKPVFEIKPGLKFSDVTQGLYVDEKKTAWDPTVTFRLRINDNFYLPVAVEYDQDKSKLFGFLSIQYSFD